MVNNDFIDKVKSQSNEELREIVVNFHKYMGALVTVAKSELATRGVELTNDEKCKIEDAKNKRRQYAIQNKGSIKSRNSRNKNWNLLNKNWKLVKKYSDTIILFFLWIVSVYSIGYSMVYDIVLIKQSLFGYGLLFVLSILKYFSIKKFKTIFTIFLIVGSFNLIQFTHSTIGVIFNFSTHGHAFSSIGLQPLSILLLICFVILNYREFINLIEEKF